MTERELPSDLDGTIVQAGDALAEAREMSARAAETPSGAGAAPSAPRIPGYTLAEVLGRGAFAQAWKAVQARTGKTVALKVFHQSRGVNWLFLRREVERLVRLDKHPHVVSLLDADLAADPPYYATDLMEGGSLERFVDPKKPVEAAKVAGWMDEIAQALSFVHGKGIIHCDLKPANVLLDSEGRVRVADFGQARVLAEGQGALGTLFYMAPEQAKLGDEGEAIQPDIRWDLYALGATAYALLTGKAPYSETLTGRLESSSSVAERLKIYRELSTQTPSLKLVGVKGLDEDLGAIVMKCLQPDPDKRYGSAGAILADLSARRTRRPVSPLAHRTGYRVKRYLQRNAVAAGIAAAAVLALGVAATRIVVQRAQLNRQVEYALVSRAKQFAREGNDPAAGAVYAELNRRRPSFFAAANALAFLDRSAVPVPLEGHTSEIGAAAFSPDGTLIVTGGADDTARVWDARTGNATGIVLQHDDRVWVTLFSPDGTLILTATGASETGGRTARLWDARTGSPVGEPMRHEDEIKTADFRPDGAVVATGSRDKTVRFWNGRTGGPLGPPISFPHGVGRIGFSGDGRWLIVAWQTPQPEGGVTVLDSVSRKIVRSGLVTNSVNLPVALSPDRMRLAVMDPGNAVTVWDTRTWTRTGSPMWHSERIASLEFSPDGSRLVSASEDGTARIWDPEACAPVGGAMRHQDWVFRAKWLPGGRHIVTGSLDRTVRIWDATGRPAGKIMPHGRPDVGFEVSPDGARLVTWTGDLAYLWDVGDIVQAEGRAVDPDGWADFTAVSRDGSRMVRLSGWRNLRGWDLPAGSPAGSTIVLGSASWWLVISRDGRIAGVGEADGNVELFDLDTGKKIPGEIRHAGGGAAIHDFSPDGRRVLTAGPDGPRVWDRTKEPPAAVPLAAKDPVTWGWFCAGGARVVTTGTSGVKLWDASNGSLVAEIDKRDSGVVSPGGEWVAAGVWSAEIQIWDAAAGKPIGLPLRHASQVTAVAFSPDGRLVLTGTFGAEAHLWEVRTGRPAGEPLRHRWGIPAVAFSPDGRVVATGTYVGQVHLWDVATGEPVGYPLGTEGPPSTIQFAADGRSLITVAQVFPQVRVWSVPWLKESVSPAALLDRAALGTGLRIGPRGELEPVPAEEFRRLRARGKP